MLLIYFIVIFVLFPIGIILLLNYILKKAFNPKVGKLISFFLIFLYFFIFPLYLYFEDNFFTRNDAFKELYKNGIYLKNNDFEIIKNKSGGFTDYYHSFEVKLSDENYKHILRNLNESDEILTLIDIEKNYSYTIIKINTKTKILSYEYFEP